MWPNNFELQNSATAILFSRCNWEKLTAKRTIGPQWHLPAPSTGIRFDSHTDIRILRGLSKCIWQFLLGFCTLLQIIHSAFTTNGALLHYSFVQTFFSKKRSNHGSLLFNVHSTIKTNKKIWSIMKISKNWHFRILDLSPCYASRPKTTLLSSFFPHIDSPSSPHPPPPLSTDKN